MGEEIKKLFEKVGAERWTCSQKIQKYCKENKDCRDPYFNPYPICVGFEECTKEYKNKVFDRFLTPEMQLEILKVLMSGTWVEFAQHFGNKFYMGRIDFKKRFQSETFEECLAGITNLMWEDLSESNKNRIKNILKVREDM